MLSVSKKLNKLIGDECVSQVEYILEEHLSEMYSFYCKYIYKFLNDTCTILVTRRSSVLFSWFFLLSSEKLSDSIEENFNVDINELITITNKKTGKKNYLISDKFLYSSMFFDFISQNKNINFVILDDICIHGRAINNTYGFIENRISLEEKKNKEQFGDRIKSAVYMLSSESQTNKINECQITLENESWLPLSNALVETINYLNLPYVSYLNSYLYFNIGIERFNAILDKFKKNDKLCLFSFSSSRQKSLGLYSYLIVEKKMCSLQEEVFSCMRIYFSKHTQTLSVIPFVMLKQLERKQIIELIKKYLKSDKQNVIESYINEKSQSSFLYELLTSIASNIYGQYCIEKYFSNLLFDEDKLEDCFLALQMTFGKKLKEVITNMSYLNSRIDMLEQHSGLDIVVYSKDCNTYNDFVRNIDIGTTLTEKWLDDEINACYLMEKEKQIPLEDLVYQNKAKGRDVLDWNKIVSIFQYCDTGTACILACDYKNGVRNAIDVGELGANLMHDTEFNNENISRKLEELFNASNYYKRLLG